jgi:hypothetical protein
MDEFLADLYAIINPIIDNFKDWAKLGVPVPYAVSNFPSGTNGSSDSKFSRGKMLEIDIYGRDTDETDIEGLIETLDLALDQTKLLGATYYAWLKHEAGFDVPEQDNELRRHQLRYSIEYKRR